MSRPRLIVYAIAFGIGLVLSLMVSRYAQGPAPPDAGPGILRYTPAVPNPIIVGPFVPKAESKTPVVKTERGPGPETSQSAALSPGAPEPPLPSPPPSRSSSFHVAPPVQNPAPQPAVPQPSSPAATPAAGRAPHGAEPPSTIVVTPAPDDAAPAGSNQTTAESPRFHVQVGTFSTREGAQTLVRRLQTLGYVATVAEGDAYRVWVGGYFDRETAMRLADTLRKAGFEVEIVP